MWNSTPSITETFYIRSIGPNRLIRVKLVYLELLTFLSFSQPVLLHYFLLRPLQTSHSPWHGRTQGEWELSFSSEFQNWVLNNWNFYFLLQGLGSVHPSEVVHRLSSRSFFLFFIFSGVKISTFFDLLVSWSNRVSWKSFFVSGRLLN